MMTKYILKLSLLPFFTLFFLFQHALAQRPGGGGRGGAPIARIYGRILDTQTKKPVPFASIVVLEMKRDTILGGGLSKDNGDFAIEKLTFGPKRLKITFLGYQDKIEMITISPKNMDKDLGNFYIELDESSLSEVVVEGEKSGVQLGIDRRVYNVDKNLTALGGTALDALKVIPSIEIDVEGNVEMRNGAPRIFIDGKPTEITLEQIPAEEIDRIEVITNPSVKYSAAATSGILNIILKKNKMPGIFGMVSAGIGSYDRYNFMSNIALRQGRFNLNASYGLRSGRGPVNEYNYRTNLQNGEPTSYFIQDAFANDSRTFQFGKVSLDYEINNRNTLSLSENFRYGNMRWPTEQDFFFGDANRDTTAFGRRSSDGRRTFFGLTSQLEWRKTFPTEGKEWSTYVSYAPNISSGTTDVNISTFDVNGIQSLNSPEILFTENELRGNTYEFQSDFTNPINDDAQWEAGIRAQYKENTNLTDAFQTIGAAGEQMEFPILANNYAYEEIISAAYYNYRGRLGAWGYQAGLRFEQSWFEGSVPDTDSSFSYAYPDGFSNLQNTFFPALYLSKKVGTRKEWQVNISRKLQRPNFWQLMPFIWQQDNQNYRSGNPNLTPEFRYIGEINYSDIFKKGSWLSSLYGRYEDNPITRVVFPVNDGSGALVNTYVNGQAQVNIGWEQTLKYQLLKWWELTIGSDISRINVNADFEGQSFENTGWNWSVNANTEVKLPWNLTFQANGRYRAPRVLPMGRTLEQYYIDIALAKKIGKTGRISLSVNDLFNTNGRGQITETAFFEQETWNRRSPRFVQLSASFRFGKPDARLFKKGRSGGRTGGGDSGGDFDG